MTSPTPSASRDLIPFRQAVKAWAAISLQTFGGPAGQIAVMQNKLVDEKRWIGQRRFLHALNFCMLLPGPEAQQLAIYTGWLLNGIKGGLVAGVLFVLPGMVALLALAGIYVAFGETFLVSALFAGLAPAVVAIVLQAVVRIGKRATRHGLLIGLAVAAFVSLAVFGVPFPVVILVAGALGWLLERRWPAAFEAGRHGGGGDDGPRPVIPDDSLHDVEPSWRRAGIVLGVGLLLWVVPLGVAWWLTGRDGVVTEQGLFFSGTALVTFGGAYAVLAYVAQRAVEDFAWVTPGEMVRGLALAETTPGPLIMVVQFVAFLGAYGDPGEMNPWMAAVLGALVTTWVTFVPCFVFIFLGAPYVERLRDNRSISAALAGITASVVGVIANLALFFAAHTLFSRTREVSLGWAGLELPVLSSVSWTAVAIAVVACVLVFQLAWSVPRVLLACAALGILLSTVGSAVA
ncbi:MAG: chromate efflux transporter [Actinomycetota bacterium]|nr:chromate efflux transporter [Actinomycetota bacterium]